MYANGSEAKYIEEAGWVQVATSQEIGIQTGSYFLSTDKYISENTDTLAKFLQAVDESTQYINDHLDESAEYLADKLGLKAEDFKENWKNYSFDFPRKQRHIWKTSKNGDLNTEVSRKITMSAILSTPMWPKSHFRIM